MTFHLLPKAEMEKRDKNALSLLSRQIKECRAARGISINEAAARCGITPRAYWNMEHGANIKVTTLCRMAYALNVIEFSFLS